MAFGKIATTFYLLKANMAFQKGNIQETLDWFRKAYMTGKAKPNTVTSYGYLLLKSGKLNEAVKVLEQQLSSSTLTNNDRYSAKSNYALALWKKGQLDAAIAELEEIFPYYRNTNIYGSLGFLYILKGDLDKALNFNLEAMDYNDSNGVILDNLGLTYYLVGDYDKANEIYKKLMTLNPTFPEAYYDYALVYEKLGDKEKCVEKLKNAQLYKPNYLSSITTEQIEAKLAEVENPI